MNRSDTAGSPAPLRVGLLNIMSGRARSVSEGLFTRLLDEALPGTPIQFRFFAADDTVEAERPVSWSGEPYRPVRELLQPGRTSLVNAIIVTGKGPQTSDLADEPAWPDLVRLAEWAEEGAVPVMWSCLSAHAAVRHLSGIRTRRLPRKLSGVFRCELASTGDPVMPGFPPSWDWPHSRCNGLLESELRASGYEILSRSPEAGPDSFARRGAALSLFCQGHPEYGPDTLLQEYRRDVRSFLAGASEEYPDVPVHYFGHDTESELSQLRECWLRGADRADPARLDAILGAATPRLRAGSRVLAARLVGQWLCCALPSRRLRPEFGAGKHPCGETAMLLAGLLGQAAGRAARSRRSFSTGGQQMSGATDVSYRAVVDDICRLSWESLTSDEMTAAAWAYYFFSVQFRESLKAARHLLPTDEKLQHLEREECDTDNLSPWPGVAGRGERMNHDEFMRRTLLLTPIDADRSERLTAIGQSYLQETRGLSAEARARAIASYEDGGLEKVFTAMLRFGSWDNPSLRAFRHFLCEHVRFDSDPDQGHGALSRHLAPDDRVLPLWEAFRVLLTSSVPALARTAEACEAAD